MINKRLHLLFSIICCVGIQTRLPAQSFTDITGPIGTVRCFLAASDGWYAGTNSKGVYRSTNDGISWTGVGGNTIMAGRINSLIYDNAGKLLAATEQGGVKSWDGVSWTNINNGLFSACGILIPVRCLVMDTAGFVYAGAHGFTACFPQGDLYRFDGTAWTAVSNGLTNKNVNTMALNPITGELVAGTEDGVFRFDGLSWSELGAGLPDVHVHELAYDPAGLLYAGTDAGIARLKPGATVWENLSTGLPAEPVFSIAIDPGNTQHLIAGTGFNLEQTGTLYGHMYESIDDGLQWIPNAVNLETTVINDIAFHTSVNGTCLAAGLGIFRSGNGGATWSPSMNGFTGRSFNTHGRVAVTRAPAHLLFYGSDDGVFRSSDGGQTWRLTSQGLDRHIITLLKTDRQGNLYCGAMRYLGENSVGFGDGALYKSKDNGDNWEKVAISKDWRYYEISEQENGDLICAHGFGAQPPSATITGSSLSRSTDQGDHWTDLDVMCGMGYCCTASAAGNLFVAGESQTVYRSTDGGASFELIVAPGQSGNVGTLESSPTGELLMGAGGTRTLYFSGDNGDTWQAFNSTVLPDYRGVSDVIFDHTGKAYCTTSGQNGTPSLFTIEPPFTAGSVFTPVPLTSGSLFKMTWDDCGYLYLYRAGGILKSTTPLRLPDSSCLSTSVSATTGVGIFQIFPNPAGNTLQIKPESPGEYFAVLMDMQGKLKRQNRFANQTDWELSGLPAGCYWLKLIAESGQTACFKVVKQ